MCFPLALHMAKQGCMVCAQQHRVILGAPGCDFIAFKLIVTHKLQTSVESVKSWGRGVVAYSELCSSHQCCCLNRTFYHFQIQSVAASRAASASLLPVSDSTLDTSCWCDQACVHLPLLSVFSHFPQAVAWSRHFSPCWLFHCVSAPCLVHPVTNGWQSRLFLIFSCIEHAPVSLQVKAFVEARVFSFLDFLSRSSIAELCNNSLVACRGNTRPAPKGYNTVCTGQPVLYKVSSPPCLHGAVITCALDPCHPRACGTLSHC